MALHSSYIAQEHRLDLSFDGNLDVSVALDMLNTGTALPRGLTYCIIDLTQVQRLFDSGLVLLKALYQQLVEVGATVIILSDHSRIRDWFPSIVRTPLNSA